MCRELFYSFLFFCFCLTLESSNASIGNRITILWSSLLKLNTQTPAVSTFNFVFLFSHSNTWLLQISPILHYFAPKSQSIREMLFLTLSNVSSFITYVISTGFISITIAIRIVFSWSYMNLSYIPRSPKCLLINIYARSSLQYYDTAASHINHVLMLPNTMEIGFFLYIFGMSWDQEARIYDN